MAYQSRNHSLILKSGEEGKLRWKKGRRGGTGEKGELGEGRERRFREGIRIGKKDGERKKKGR